MARGGHLEAPIYGYRNRRPASGGE